MTDPEVEQQIFDLLVDLGDDPRPILKGMLARVWADDILSDLVEVARPEDRMRLRSRIAYLAKRDGGESSEGGER